VYVVISASTGDAKVIWKIRVYRGKATDRRNNDGKNDGVPRDTR